MRVGWVGLGRDERAARRRYDRGHDLGLGRPDDSALIEILRGRR